MIKQIVKDSPVFYDIMLFDKNGKVIDRGNPQEIGADKSQGVCFVDAKEKSCIKDVALSGKSVLPFPARFLTIPVQIDLLGLLFLDIN